MSSTKNHAPTDTIFPPKNAIPKFEMRENNHSYVISVEVPGIREDDMTVALRDNHLVLEGDRRPEDNQAKGESFFSEFSYGSFCRSIPLAKSVNPDLIKATFKDGILKVEIEKLRPIYQRVKSIPIMRL